MEYVKKKLSAIKPYENNPRINDDAVNDVVESIKQCTYIAPIVVDEDGVILAGHTRYKALRNSIFSARIVCGECGSFYGPRYWSTKSDGRRIVWRCSNKYGKGHECNAPIVTENELKMKFVEALNEIVDDREIVLENCRCLYESLSDTSDLDEEIDGCLRECELISELSGKLLHENMSREMDQGAFMKKYGSYTAKFNAENDKLEQLKAQRAERIQRSEMIGAFMFELQEQESFIEDFSEKIWLVSIETVTVHKDGRMIFRFKNGMEVTK